MAEEVWDPSRPLKDDSLLASKQSLSDLLGPDYWRRLGAVAGGMHCDDPEIKARVKPLKLPGSRLKDLKQQIKESGVAQVSAPELSISSRCDVSRLARGVEGILRAGWPASFIVMFDEAWVLIDYLSEVMRNATGNACNMDVLAWYVDPNRGQAGFSPHRDRQPDDSPSTFRGDGSAMYTTAWVALTDAEPSNSCLYVVPSYADPGYHEGDPDDLDAADPLQRALHNKEAYQHIRALPCPAGAAVIFTHRIIHWGSQGRKGHPTPRISLSFGCADDCYEPPYFDRSNLPFPPLELRLALASAQQLIYHERFPATAKQLILFHNAFKPQAHRFDSAYAAKVRAEFLAATRDLEARGARAQGGGSTAAAKGGSSKAANGAPAQNGAAASSKEMRRAAAGGSGKKRVTGQKRGEEEERRAREEQQEEEQQVGRKRRGKKQSEHTADEGRQKRQRKSGKGHRQEGQEEELAAAEAEAEDAAGSLDRSRLGKKGAKGMKAAAAAPTGKRKQAKGKSAAAAVAAAAAAVEARDDGEDDDEDEGGDDLLRALEEGRRAAAAAKKGKQGASGKGVNDDDDDDGEGALVDLALEDMLDDFENMQDDYEG